jgi:hypothetical protein
MGKRNAKEQCKFSVSPSHQAMIRVVFNADAFVPKQQSVKATVKLRTKDKKGQVKALIDSGATDNFIAPTLARRYKFPTYKLGQPRTIHNVDGTQNSLRNITEATDLEVYYGPIMKKETFFIINLGGDEMLLGYPFLSNTNPPINWKTSTFYGNVTIATKDAHLWTPERQLQLLKEIKPEMYETEKHDPHFIPSNKRGTILYPKKYLRKTTTATDLAIEARDKKEQTWQEIVPKPYHAYGKVFNEIKAMHFPKSRPWDHAIEFTEDIPKTIDCKLI